MPWYAAWVGGRPDYRIVLPEKIREALQFELCWICGTTLGRFSAFLISPAAAVTRETNAPPAHASCAEYAVRVVPTGLPVAVVWVTLRFDIWFPTRHEGPVIRIGDPVDVFWFARGQRACRHEAIEALALGLPELRQRAMQAGPTAVVILDHQISQAKALIPADDAPLARVVTE